MWVSDPSLFTEEVQGRRVLVPQSAPQRLVLARVAAVPPPG